MTQPGHFDLMKNRLDKFKHLPYSQILTNKRLLPHEREYLLANIPTYNQSLTGNKLFFRRKEDPKQEESFLGNKIETFMEEVDKAELFVALSIVSFFALLFLIILIFKK